MQARRRSERRLRGVREPPAAFVGRQSEQRRAQAGDLLCLVARRQDEIYRLKSAKGDKKEQGNCSSSMHRQVISKKKRQA